MIKRIAAMLALSLVAGTASAEEPVKLGLLLDMSGVYADVTGPDHGSDVDDKGYGRVSEQRLYQLIRQTAPIQERQFEIEFLDSGVEAFAFTFG